MARPKSEDKRNAIMAAATRVIAAQGLGAPTAKIAEEAGVANGSLFTYFETKTDLFNQLYLELKTAMASAALEGLPAGADLRSQTLHVWSNWMDWAFPIPTSVARWLSSAFPTKSHRRAASPDTRPWRALAALMRSCAQRPDA